MSVSTSRLLSNEYSDRRAQVESKARNSAFHDEHAARCVVNEMSQHGPLSEAELRHIGKLGARPITYAPHVSMTQAEGQYAPFFVLTGWAMRIRPLPDGRQQVIAFILPGDFVGTAGHGCAIVSVKQTTVAPATAFLRDVVGSEQPISGIVSAMKKSADLERDWLLERIVRLGKLDARSRMAHLFLELRHRLDRVGLVSHDEFSLPVTQETLSETVGISMVHANRSLQQLRRDRLIELHGGRVRLINRGRMELLCEFTPPGEEHG